MATDTKRILRGRAFTRPVNGEIYPANVDLPRWCSSVLIIAHQWLILLRNLGSVWRGIALPLALSLGAVAKAETKVGDAFPALTSAGLVTLAGGDVASTAGKVVLVDFWASWCAPCKASFPMMTQLHKDYAARGFVIAAVGVDEKPAAAVAFAKKLAPPFATLHDKEQKLVKQVVPPTMPTSYLIGRDGRVRFVHQGFHGDTTDRELRKEIEALLAEQK